MRSTHRISRALRYARKHGVRATANEAAWRTRRALGSDRYPPTVHLEVSNCCNLRCEYCVLDEGAQGDRIMSDKTFEAILPALAHARRIDLSGLAEPLMNKRLVPMVARIRKIAPRAHLTLCTNATLLTAEISEQLVAHELDELVFSLDGVDPSSVDTIRKGGSFENMLGNIESLQATKKRLGSSKPVLSATVVLQATNFEQLPSIIDLAADLGCVAVNVNGLEPYSKELIDQAVWISLGNFPGLAEVLETAEARARASGVELRLPALSLQKPVCPQIFRPIVLADGTVVPCSVLAYFRRTQLTIGDGSGIVQEERATERLAFGNAAHDGLENVWSTETYKAFRERVESGDFPDACTQCLMKHGVICPTPPLNAEESLASAGELR